MKPPVVSKIGKPGHESGVDVSGVAEKEPAHWPVDHVDMAVLVSRAKHDIGLPYRLQELGQPLRIVRKIGVHLEHQIVLSLERPAKPGDVSGPESKLCRPDE